MKTLELHPLCSLFPRLPEPELQALVEDIRANGLKHEIVLRDGQILDGGNRYAACLKAGVKPVFTNYTGANPVAYVLSQNLHRRHLTAGQQAAIVASAQDWANAQGIGRPEKSVQLNTFRADTTAARAAQSGASVMTQRRADKVAKADPELAKKVAHGEVSLPKAVAEVEAKKPKKASKPKKAKEEKRAEPSLEVAESEDSGPSAEEWAYLERKQEEFRQKLGDLLETNEPLRMATERWERAELTIATLQLRINGLMSENAELIKEVKKWRNVAQRAA